MIMPPTRAAMMRFFMLVDFDLVIKLSIVLAENKGSITKCEIRNRNTK
jgi:hypothetical protein